ncbi:hypothetical protein DIT71_16980 [Marinobacter vulgaris]|uniref:Uncharacterized protein n=1 Tax=Marinobacter vulgaris TaxID=1928331 RepID=A0A2V3ZGE6_9GAMM|nr:hypothetical protein [Marinobacter vulgaris]PXX88882.1 hypothetical protein DIT71_16980 [Marinobacter vulgaris]TSJ66687.1 hypothetical protein FPC41_17105 [Marinobacter vulgaris]
MLFAIEGLAILTWLHWELSAVAVTYVAAGLTIYSAIWAKAPNQWATISSQLGKHLNTLANVGFITFFGLVTEYMLSTTAEFPPVLRSSTLSPQLFSQITVGVNGINVINSNQPKFKALTFENNAFAPAHEEKHGSVWIYLTDESYKRQLIEQLCKLNGAKPRQISINWMRAGLKNVLQFSQVSATNGKYLMKVLEKDRTDKARQITNAFPYSFFVIDRILLKDTTNHERSSSTSPYTLGHKTAIGA